MNGREFRRYEMFARVQVFGSDNSADNAPGSIAATCFINLGPVVSDMGTAKAAQKPGRDTSREVVLDAIRLDMQNITRTASAITLTEPGFADSFGPPAQFNPGTMITTADKFINQLAAQPGDSAAVTAAKTVLVGKFVAHEMPANFVIALQSDRAAYDVDRTQHETKREAGVGSTATIGMNIAKGMRIVTTLDAIMHNKYASQPAKMAAWLTASHIERDPHRGQPPVTPAPNGAPIS